MPASCDFLFVYGTLRPPFNNTYAQYLRQCAHYVGNGTFPGLLFDLGNYPGAVYQPEGQSKVIGTMYTISPNNQQLLAYLDEYEGIGEQFDHPTEYVRAIIPVHHDNKVILCWTYLYNLPTDGKLLIESGDYVQYGNY